MKERNENENLNKKPEELDISILDELRSMPEPEFKPELESESEPEPKSDSEADPEPEPEPEYGELDLNESEIKQETELTPEKESKFGCEHVSEFEKKEKKEKDSSLKDILRGAVIGLVAILLIAIFIKPIIVQGSSMEPTINDKDYLLISRQAYKIGEPERGDVVVFPHHQGTEDALYIKRVIAIPGDHLKIKNGKVYINNKLQDEEYLADGTQTSGNIDFTIPEGEIFVMGDNRGNSSDSRSFGTVSIDDVTGKVFVRLFPFNKIGGV